MGYVLGVDVVIAGGGFVGVVDGDVTGVGVCVVCVLLLVVVLHVLLLLLPVVLCALVCVLVAL